MESLPLISIITPVYNIQDFVDECIDSVVAQDFSEWELILVDDGSVDASGDICRRRAESDSRIRLVRRENGGQSRARNSALHYVRGKYIVFLDSDDILAPDALTILLNAALKAGAGIAVAGFERSRRRFDAAVASRSPSRIKSSPLILNPDEAVRKMLYQRGLDNSCSWKIFEASLWKDMRFLPGSLYEDLEIVPQVFLKAESIAVIPDIVYYYRQHSDSTIHTFNMRRLDVLDVTEGLLHSLPSKFKRAVAERRFSAANNIFALLTVNAPEAQSEADRCWGIIRETRSSVLADRRCRLKSRVAALLSYLGGRTLMTFLARLLSRLQ